MTNSTNNRLYGIVKKLNAGQSISDDEYMGLQNYTSHCLRKLNQPKFLVKNFLQDITQELILLLLKTKRSFDEDYITRQLYLMIKDVINSLYIQDVWRQQSNTISEYEDDTSEEDDGEIQ